MRRVQPCDLFPGVLQLVIAEGLPALAQALPMDKPGYKHAQAAGQRTDGDHLGCPHPSPRGEQRQQGFVFGDLPGRGEWRFIPRVPVDEIPPCPVQHVGVPLRAAHRLHEQRYACRVLS
jgi:hypothetical protein